MESDKNLSNKISLSLKRHVLHMADLFFFNPGIEGYADKQFIFKFSQI